MMEGVAPWNSPDSTPYTGGQSKNISMSCMLAKVGVHCVNGIVRRVEVIPGIVVPLCICDDHFFTLQRHVKTINDTFKELNDRIAQLEAEKEAMPAGPNWSIPSVSKALTNASPKIESSEPSTTPRKDERIVDPAKRSAIWCNAPITHQGQTFLCRRKSDHSAKDGERSHYYYNRNGFVLYWDEKGFISSGRGVAA